MTLLAESRYHNRLQRGHSKRLSPAVFEVESQFDLAESLTEIEFPHGLDLLEIGLKVLKTLNQRHWHLNPPDFLVADLFPEVGAHDVHFQLLHCQKTLWPFLWLCNQLLKLAIEAVAFLDVVKHHVTRVQAVLAKSKFHVFQVLQFFVEFAMNRSQQSFIEDLPINLQELFLGTIDINQITDLVVSSPTGRNVKLTETQRMWLPLVGGSFVIVCGNVSVVCAVDLVAG